MQWACLSSMANKLLIKVIIMCWKIQIVYPGSNSPVDVFHLAGTVLQENLHRGLPVGGGTALRKGEPSGAPTSSWLAADFTHLYYLPGPATLLKLPHLKTLSKSTFWNATATIPSSSTRGVRRTANWLTVLVGIGERIKFGSCIHANWLWNP